ncbi:AraC family transcriptional regulator [Nocardia uniformis]|uniref:AraC family transcriptional regulator n=1 Tax=Nocardia uniformis TaxID=53432 RepID=A0A849C000_9NOCA|nr:AraC family transcriptional regulator [Nocardia uniformis]NNH71914.1 AraC family transcriptional regulator [Nocardia uniformis]
MSETYFPLAVSPSDPDEFHGWISHGSYSGVELSAVGSTSQRVRRTDRAIADAEDEHLLAGIFVKGHGRLHVGDQVAALGPGMMVLYSSGRKYHWDLDGDWQKAVVQIPLDRLRDHSGLTLDDVPTVLALPGTSATGVVSRFFCGLADLQRTDPEQAAVLASPAMDLLVSAVTLAAGSAPPTPDAFVREQVLDYMRAHCADPGLTVHRIAEGCMMSRRTLYRVFDDFEGGPAAVLRRMRVERACELLARTTLSIAAVANAAGFLTDRHFYRAFRTERGMTPAAFRVTDTVPFGRRPD